MSSTQLEGDLVRRLVDVLQGLVDGRTVTADSHFFDDLGANSLTMTHFCAKVRKLPDLPTISIRDIYRSPSIALLVDDLVDETSAAEPTVAAPPEPEAVAGSTVQVVRCAAVQGLVFVVYAYLVTLVSLRGYDWVVAGSSTLEVYLRAVAGGGAAFVGVCLLPVAAKWLLVGRWTAREIPLWSMAYVRFWVVKSLLHSSPIILFVGSPLYVVYLRLLGARVGRGVTILSRSVPVCTDLLTIGDGTVVRKDSFLLGYRAEAGVIRTGSVTLGREAFVGEKTVLDVDTAVGDGAQLGHSSSLRRGESIPAGARWHGSPAVPTDIDHVRVPEVQGVEGRRARYTLSTVLQVLLVYVPLATAGAHVLSTWVPDLGGVVPPVPTTVVGGLVDAAVLSLVVVLVVLPGGLAIMFTVPRLLGRLLRADTVYPLYGWQYSVHRTIQAMTNRRLFTWLFGDSSYVVPYLRGLGYHMPKVEQTGSNFGTEVQHETPLHVTVGSGTMVADGLSILNADYSASSFRISRVTLGAHSFLGNNIAYPSGGRIGENCLLATKVMVPLDGPVREGVGLLGAPAFEIPRTVERDSSFDHLREGDELARRLRAKNRYNLRSMALMLGVRWIGVLLVSLLGFLVLGGTVDGVLGELLIAVYLPLTLAITTGVFVLAERLITGFRPLQPQLRSIYDPYFWWHERLWKVPDVYLNLFNGTPLKPLVWRMLGVQIGRRVFDDGAYITERTLTAIGDDAVLNVGSKLQGHSQEDGTFKSDHIRVGAGVTLAVGAFIHYGTTIGDAAVIDTDTFLMKGEDVPPRARWQGNPAAPVGTGGATAVVRALTTGASS